MTFLYVSYAGALCRTLTIASPLTLSPPLPTSQANVQTRWCPALWSQPLHPATWQGAKNISTESWRRRGMGYMPPWRWRASQLTPHLTNTAASICKAVTLYTCTCVTVFVCYIEYCMSVTIIYPLPYTVASPPPPHSHVCENEILVNQKYKSTRLLDF